MTIHQLLTHTSGLASETPEPLVGADARPTLRPELADVLGKQPVRHPAGRRHHYSNPGYALLGALVGRTRGPAGTRRCSRRSWTRSGMARTTLSPEPPHARGFAVHPWATSCSSSPPTPPG